MCLMRLSACYNHPIDKADGKKNKKKLDFLK